MQDHNNASGNEEGFDIIADDQLATQQFHDQWVSVFGGPTYDITDPRSINSLLGHTRRKEHPNQGQWYSNSVPQVTGHVNPNHENVIYLHCPQLTGMRNRGPVQTSGSCVAPLPIQGVYGDVLFLFTV